MIIDLTVSNFRSIKNEQIFSMYSENKTEHLAENIVYPSGDKIGVLKTACIYGANASGKSNLLKAFHALSYLAVNSGDLKEEDPIPFYEPYILSSATKKAAINFEIEFALQGKRYIYKVSYNNKKIVSESLDYYPGRQKANIYTREEGQSWQEITFGTHYKGGKKRIAFFDNNTYLSKAGNSADTPSIIRDIYSFFRTGIIHIENNHEVQVRKWKKNEGLVQAVFQAVQGIDLGIQGFEFRKKDLKFPTDVPEKMKQIIIEDLGEEVFFHHTSEDDGLIPFAENDESSGTIRLFHLMPLIFTVINTGSILIFDELEKNFHPHVAEVIIKLFQDPSVNIKMAQLIYSTHNIGLMSPDLLRRDQIWFTQKEKGITSIYSLDEYDKSTVKNTSPFGKWYDEGRFEAVPLLNYGAIASALRSM